MSRFPRLLSINGAFRSPPQINKATVCLQKTCTLMQLLGAWQFNDYLLCLHAKPKPGPKVLCILMCVKYPNTGQWTVLLSKETLLISSCVDFTAKTSNELLNSDDFKPKQKTGKWNFMQEHQTHFRWNVIEWRSFIYRIKPWSVLNIYTLSSEAKHNAALTTIV